MIVTIALAGFPVDSPVSELTWSYLYVNFTSSPIFTVLLAVTRVRITFVARLLPPPAPENWSVVLITSPPAFKREIEYTF